MQQVLFDFIEKYITLSDKEKEVIGSLDIFRTVKKGDVLLAEGASSNEGYFVLNGCLRTYFVIDGEEKTTAFFTELEGHTPNCVLSKALSEYYVAATEDSIITVSTPDMEEDMFDQFPNFEKLCRILSEELLAKEQIDFSQFKTSNPEQRYLDLIAKRPDLIQRVPQHQLASFLGITPQSLSRLRARVLEKKV